MEVRQAPNGPRHKKTQTVAHNMIVSAFSNLAVPAAAFASAPFLARELGVSGRGHFAAATASLLLFTTIAAMGVPDAVTHFVARSGGDSTGSARIGTRVLAISGAIATIVGVSTAAFVAGGSHSVQMLIIYTSILTTPILLVGIPRGIASGRQRWTLVNGEKYITALVRVVGIAVFSTFGALTVTSATTITALSLLFAAAAYVPLLRSRDPRNALQETPPGFTTYAGRTWVGSLTGILLSRLDQTLMSSLSGAYQLGLYAAAVNISDASLLINNAVRDVTFAADSGEMSSSRWSVSARVSFLASIISGIAIILLSYLFFTTVFGQAYAGAVPVLTILVCASVVGVPGSVAGAGLSARGRPGLRSISLCIALAANATAVVIVVPRYGAIGAAWATLLGNLIASNINIWFARKFYDQKMRTFYLVRISDVTLLIRALTSFIR